MTITAALWQRFRGGQSLLDEELICLWLSLKYAELYVHALGIQTHNIVMGETDIRVMGERVLVAMLARNADREHWRALAKATVANLTVDIPI